MTRTTDQVAARERVLTMTIWRYEDIFFNNLNVFFIVLLAIQEENDSLRCQLHAYKNEVDLVKSDSDFFKSDTELKNKQIKALQEHARKLIEMNRDSEARINTLEAKLKEANVKELLLKTKIANRSQQKWFN